MARRHALGEAVRTAGVVGHVAADRAGLLAARIGSEVQAVDGDGAAEVEVEHARLDPGPTCVRIDRADPVHLGERDDHRARRAAPHRRPDRFPSRGRRTARRRASATRTHAATSAVLIGKQTTAADPCHVPGVAAVQRQFGAAVADPIGADRAAQLARRGSARGGHRRVGAIGPAQEDDASRFDDLAVDEHLVTVGEVVAAGGPAARRARPAVRPRGGAPP